jgi:hypothetical protein
MELWQMLLLLVIGLDVVVQLLKLNQESANGKKIQALIDSLDGDMDTRPTSITDLARDNAHVKAELKWIKEALNNTYGMVSGQFTKLETTLAAAKPTRRVKK